MVVPQQVVRLQRVRRDELHAFQVPASELQVSVGRRFNQQNRLRVPVQTGERLSKRLGLVRIELPRIHHGQLLLRKLCRKRGAQSAEEHFFRQAVRVAARHRPVHCAALAPDRAANRSHACAARALLLPQFSARPGHFAATLGLVRPRALRRLIPAHRFVEQVWVHLRPKHRVGQVHLTDVLAFEILDVHYRHCRRVLYYVTTTLLLRYFDFRAFRMRIYVPTGPGTEPYTRSKFSSVSTFTTRRFFAVTRELPMCPGKCCPGQTREGKELPPMPPGARWCMDPCVASPPRKCHRLTAPAKPLPLLMPVTSTNSPGWNRSTRTRSPALVSSAESSSRTSRKRRMGAASAFLKCPSIGLVTRCGLINSTRPSCAAS